MGPRFQVNTSRPPSGSAANPNRVSPIQIRVTATPSGSVPPVEGQAPSVVAATPTKTELLRERLAKLGNNGEGPQHLLVRKLAVSAEVIEEERILCRSLQKLLNTEPVNKIVELMDKEFLNPDTASPLSKPGSDSDKRLRDMTPSQKLKLLKGQVENLVDGDSNSLDYDLLALMLSSIHQRALNLAFEPKTILAAIYIWNNKTENLPLNELNEGYENLFAYDASIKAWKNRSTADKVKRFSQIMSPIHFLFDLQVLADDKGMVATHRSSIADIRDKREELRYQYKALLKGMEREAQQQGLQSAYFHHRLLGLVLANNWNFQDAQALGLAIQALDQLIPGEFLLDDQPKRLFLDSSTTTPSQVRILSRWDTEERVIDSKKKGKIKTQVEVRSYELSVSNSKKFSVQITSNGKVLDIPPFHGNRKFRLKLGDQIIVRHSVTGEESSYIFRGSKLGHLKELADTEANVAASKKLNSLLNSPLISKLAADAKESATLGSLQQAVGALANNTTRSINLDAIDRFFFTIGKEIQAQALDPQGIRGVAKVWKSATHPLNAAFEAIFFGEDIELTSWEKKTFDEKVESFYRLLKASQPILQARKHADPGQDFFHSQTEEDRDQFLQLPPSAIEGIPAFAGMNGKDSIFHRVLLDLVQDKKWVEKAPAVAEALAVLNQVYPGVTVKPGKNAVLFSAGQPQGPKDYNAKPMTVMIETSMDKDQPPWSIYLLDMSGASLSAAVTYQGKTTMLQQGLSISLHPGSFIWIKYENIKEFESLGKDPSGEMKFIFRGAV